MKFVKPEMERILFDPEDIIVTSCSGVCNDCKMHLCYDDNTTSNDTVPNNVLG